MKRVIQYFQFGVKSIRYNWDAQTSTPINLWAAATGMIINNIFFIYGLWLMMFAGKAQNNQYFQYTLALMTITAFAWGFTNFFFGGLRFLADSIDSGALDPALGTPCSPLILVSMTQSNAAALGDLVQSLLMIVYLGWTTGLSYAFHVGVAAVLCAIGFIGVFIFAGSFAFFISPGSSIANFLIEATLSLSVYPVGKVLSGPARLLMLLSPAFLVAVLPMGIVEYPSWSSLFVAGGSILVFLVLSVRFFAFGLTRYKSGNLAGSMRN